MYMPVLCVCVYCFSSNQSKFEFGWTCPNCKLEYAFGLLILLFLVVNFTKCGNESWTVRPSACSSSILGLETHQGECCGLGKDSFI